MASSAAGPSASAGASGSGSSGFSNIPASGPGSSGFSGIPTSGSSTNNTNRHETATNQKKDSIIIGIDFGTTFSGAAWCYTGLGDRNKTKIVKSWPSNPKSLDKVSSIIQYSTKDTSKYKWGFEVNTDAQNPLKWFKLLLNQDSAGSNVTPVNSRPIPGSGDIRNQTGSLDSSIQGLNINDPAPIPETYTQNDSEQLAELFATLAALPQEKSPVDVVTDYLRAVYKHTRATIEKDYLPSFSSRIGTDIPLQFVLTVPAVWSDSAKALTLQAARAAGMDESYAKIQLVSEPEAAAIHCLKNYKETQDSLQVGDVYVIADCGGGTVDLISYEITEVEPRLRVKECAIGTGGLCGSTSLNRRFEALIKSRVGETEYANMSAIARGNTMRHFDDYLKPTFLPPEFSDISTGFEDEDDFDEVASYSCPLPGVAENPQKGIYKGHLILTADEMKSVFEPTFTRITRLVQEQVLAAEKKSEKNVTGILLVGGFGSSPYLYKHLSTEIKNKEGKEVKILQPVDAWTAIVRGAVSYGLSLSLGDSPDVADVPSVDSRIARFSYGVCAAERFIPGYHPSNRMVFNRWAGDFYCPGRMQWFVTVGDEIPENEPISVPFVRRCPTGAEKSDFIYTEEILCSEQPGRPPLNVDHDDIKHLLLFKADMSEVSRKKHFTRRRAAHGGDPYWEIRFNVLMKYHSASLEFWVEVGDKPVGKGTVEYMHEPPKGGAKEEYGL